MKKNIEINPLITFSINDENKVMSLGGFKVIQQILLLIFSKAMVNPIWISIKNRFIIKRAIILAIDANANTFEDLINSNKLNFLKYFYKKKSVGIFKKLSSQTQHIYDHLFCSQFLKQQNFKKNINVEQNQENSKYLTYEELLIKKYDSFKLSEYDLTLNLFPHKSKQIYSNYIKLNKSSENINKIEKKIVALDCEMVRTEFGNELARISLIDFNCKILIDEYVKPTNPILDYNTKYSGITEEILKNVKTTLKMIQTKFLEHVSKETIIIGHSLENDLYALQIIHKNIIDTSVLYHSNGGYKVSLKNLAKQYLNCTIQKNEHDSVEDAKIALSLARLRIEILDNLSMSSLNQNQNPDILNRLLVDNNTVLILDEQEMLQSLPLDNRFHTDPYKKNDININDIFDKLRKWNDPKLKNCSKEHNLIFSRIPKKYFEKKDEDFIYLDKKLEELYNFLENDTIIFMFSCNEDKEHDYSEKDVSKIIEDKGFLLFISK